MDQRFLHLSIASLLTLGVGLYPFWVRRNEITRWFALSHVSLALWCMNESIAFVPISHSARVVFYRLSYIFAVVMVWYWYRFLLQIAGRTWADFPRTSLGVKVVGWITIALTFTPWLVANIKEGPPFEEIPGPAYPVFIFLLVWYMGFAIYQCGRGYAQSAGLRRARLRYLFFANALILTEGILFFVSLYGPDMGYFYFYLEVVYAAIVAYAIVAHQLMDITVIIRKTVISSTMMGLLTVLYLLIIPTLTRLLQNAGSAHFLSSVIAAMIVTLVFNPLLDMVRAFMDRRFFGDWLKDMSRGVIHEVKRPLSGIQLPANLVLVQMDEVAKGTIPYQNVIPQIKAQMRLIISKASEMSDRIEALQAVSGMEEDDSASADVTQVTESCLERLRYFLEEWKIHVKTDIPDALPPVHCDPKQLAVVVTNLIKNAADALRLMKPPRTDPRVTLKVWATGGDILISVQDNGPGITPEAMEHLFQMGFTTKEGQGMGIGLNLIRKIVQNHRGSIDVKSEVGAGTEFLVRLPKGDAK